MGEAAALRMLALLMAGRVPRAASGQKGECSLLTRVGRFHGVLPLIHAAWSAEALAGVTSSSFATACAEEARAVAALDLAHRVATTSVLGALAESGLRPLLLKGAALAYTHYAIPALRPRSDVDLLIADGDRELCAASLSRLGYERVPQLPGRYVSSEETWRRFGQSGPVNIDLHWRVNNSPVLASLLDYAEIDGAALPVPAFGASARGPDATHALLLAALHREGSRDAPYHHVGWSKRGGDRLIWLVDFVLLVRRADPIARGRMRELVRVKGAQPLIAAAADALRRHLPEFAGEELSWLADLGASGVPDRRLRRYLAGGAWTRRVLDLAALGDWRARFGYLGEQLYPPVDYLRRRDPLHAGSTRPVLALRRLLRRGTRQQ